MDYIIPDAMRTAVLNYLGTRPWVEVNDLIVAVINLPPAEQEKPSVPEKTVAQSHDCRQYGATWRMTSDHNRWTDSQ
jgi:hypothetical protein